MCFSSCGLLYSETQHQFNSRENDWGFTSFMPIQDIYDPSKGYLVNDTLILSAEVSVQKVVDNWAYDSKKETGFVGLKNQGATCYMNSLLQTQYHIPYFRKVFYYFSLAQRLRYFSCSMYTLQIVLSQKKNFIFCIYIFAGSISYAYY